MPRGWKFSSRKGNAERKFDNPESARELHDVIAAEKLMRRRAFTKGFTPRGDCESGCIAISTACL
jgi:hypothetical protein